MRALNPRVTIYKNLQPKIDAHTISNYQPNQMKPSFVVLAIAAKGVLSLDFTYDGLVCQRKNVNLMKAIDAFCSNDAIVVPSAYAYDGKWVGGQQARIKGACSNMGGGKGVWVPSEYCYSQMWSTCANGGANGAGSALFGSKKCQLFQTNPGPYY